MAFHSSRLRLRLLCAATLFAAAACRPQGGDAGASPAGAELARSARGRAASAEVRTKTGMSHLPGPQSEDALRASLRRHYPQQLQDRTGAVLLEVEVDARGTVRDVDVVTPPSAAHPTHRAVIVDGESSVRRAMEFQYDPAFGAAAQAALRETRFTPAVRASDDRAVPFRWRMTVVFDPSLAS